VGPTGILHDFIALRFAARGFNVLVQDVRGCFESEGEFYPFRNEAIDGKSTLEWIQEQSWFNGVLGMWGPSYLGYVQWAIAGNGPLYLKAIVPAITGANLPFVGYRDGALTLDMVLRWIIQLDAFDRKKYISNWSGLRKMLPSNMEKKIYRASMKLPLEDLDIETVGKQVPFLREWMEHLVPNDPYWLQFDHSDKMPQVTASVHLVSGWFDILLRELLEDYAKLNATKGRRPYLTIGPWHHLDTACLLETLRQGIDWFDVHLKGEKSQIHRKPVVIYVLGSGEWREFDEWPPPSRELAYYLHRNIEQDKENARVLSLNQPEGFQESDSYIYNPSDPTPAVGGANMSFAAGQVDNRELERRSDVLTYTTQPLDEVLEVIGPVRLWLYVKSDREYTDFHARLCDVYPDGRSLNVCDGIFRVYPETGEKQEDGSLLIEIDMWSTAIRFQKEHCIRLQISSGAHPRWYRNLGTNEQPVSATKMFSARQTIYHDVDHPSVLLLPKLKK